MSIILAAFAALPREAWGGPGHAVRRWSDGDGPQPRRTPDQTRRIAERISLEQRHQRILALRARGAGIGAIASLVECSQRTVRRVLEEGKQHGA